MSTAKLNLYDASKLRTIVDENLSDVLGSLGYTESFTLVDIKLALGVVTVALSGLLFLLEKKVPFNESFNLIVAILAAYFAVSGVLLYLNSFSRKNIKYVGHDDSNNKITIITDGQKYDPTMSIELRFGEDSSAVTRTTVELNNLFDNFTSFHAEKLKEVIGNEIQVNKKKSQ